MGDECWLSYFTFGGYGVRGVVCGVVRNVEKTICLTLYQPMTHICVMSSHKPIRIYMGF